MKQFSDNDEQFEWEGLDFENVRNACALISMVTIFIFCVSKISWNADPGLILIYIWYVTIASCVFGVFLGAIIAILASPLITPFVYFAEWIRWNLRKYKHFKVIAKGENNEREN